MELDTYGTASDLQELLAVRDSIQRLVEHREGDDALLPRAELRDAGEAYHLLVDVPGVTQENLEIAVQGAEVIVAGVREREGDGELVFGERPRGPFQRTVTLPGDVDPEGAQARLASGVLVLHLPKRDGSVGGSADATPDAR